MFSKWLEVDANATWGKLKRVFISPALTCKNASNESKTHNGKMCPNQYMYTIDFKNHNYIIKGSL